MCSVVVFQNGFEQIKKDLRLFSLGQLQSNESLPLEHQETGILLLGECAVQCHQLELECLLLLAAEGSLVPQALPLVAATIDWVATTLGYPHRRAYIALHEVPLYYAWFSGGMGFMNLTSVLSLLATSERASQDIGAFLSSSTKSLVAAMVVAQDQKSLLELSAALKKEVTYHGTVSVEPRTLIMTCWVYFC